jgi:PleD family two-component response regulator
LDEIRQEFANSPLLTDSLNIEITASIGLTEMIASGSFAATIKQADDCLYKAKHNGKNCVVCG